MPVSQYLYLLFYSLFLINRSLFVRCSIILLASFSSVFVIVVVRKEKRTILTLNRVQVFRSRVTRKAVEVPVVPAACSTSSSRVNKHHTADSTDFVLV